MYAESDRAWTCSAEVRKRSRVFSGIEMEIFFVLVVIPLCYHYERATTVSDVWLRFLA